MNDLEPIAQYEADGISYSVTLSPNIEVPVIPTRPQIEQLQAAMLPIQCEMPEAEHFFAPGMYGRRFCMPAGMLVVGKTHKHAHLMMLSKGRATVITEFDRVEIEAGFVHVSQPGAKRVVLAHEDCVFVTVHLNPTNTEDLVVIEADHIEPEPEFEALKQEIMKVLS
jgi:quercetin dioxygenase-like cupin family protein